MAAVQVVIHCMQTGRLVSTGLEIDREDFTDLPDRQVTLIECPACGNSHEWSKADAMLKAPPQRPSL